MPFRNGQVLGYAYIEKQIGLAQRYFPRLDRQRLALGVADGPVEPANTSDYEDDGSVAMSDRRVKGGLPLTLAS